MEKKFSNLVLEEVKKPKSIPALQQNEITLPTFLLPPSPNNFPTVPNLL